MSKRDSRDFESAEALRNILKSSPSATRSNFTSDDQQINELASLLGSINETEAPRASAVLSRRYVPTSTGIASSSTTGLRSNLTTGASATSLLQKTLDRASTDIRDSREGRLAPTSGDDYTSRRFQTTSSAPPIPPVPTYSSYDRASTTLHSESEPDSTSDRSWMRGKSTASSSTATSAPSQTAPSAVPAFQDTVDFNVVRFNNDYSFRTKQGKYLQTIADDSNDRDDASVATFSSEQYSVASRLRQNSGIAEKNVPQNTSIFLLGADGQGVGELTDALQFINLEQKDSTGPIMYGTTIAIKSTAAKERLLGIKDGSRIGFWRHFVGEGEKWIITKAVGASPLSGCHGITVPITSLGIEDVSARHTRYVRVGDMILLQTKKSEHYLSVQDLFQTNNTATSTNSLNPNQHISSTESIKLIYKERGGLLGAQEALLIEHFGTVPLPTWLSSRPYLSRQMLQVPATLTQPTSELHQRLFPRSSSSSLATTAAVTASLLSTYAAAAKQRESDSSHASSSSFSYSELKKVVPLGQFSLVEQQRMVLRDVLCTCMGINGTYIRALPQNMVIYIQRQRLLPPSVFAPSNWGKISELSYSFVILPGTEDHSEGPIDVTTDADRSLVNQINELLPFITMILHLRDFVSTQSQYDYGLVSHAFVCAIRRLLQEFDVLLCQLEHLLNQGKLTIQKLLFFLQPSRKMMLVLYRVCYGGHIPQGNQLQGGTTSNSASFSAVDAGSGAKDLIGGQLLQHLILQLQAQGDEQAKQLLTHIVHETATPFLTMIAHWIYRGELHDPYHEFMIEEDRSVRKEALQADFNAQYWDHRYTLRAKHIPMALFSMEIAQRILMTGKYLNVVRDCVGDAILSSSSGQYEHAQHNDGDEDEGDAYASGDGYRHARGHDDDNDDDNDDDLAASAEENDVDDDDNDDDDVHGDQASPRKRRIANNAVAMATKKKHASSSTRPRRGAQQQQQSNQHKKSSSSAPSSSRYQPIVLPKAKTLVIDIDGLFVSYHHSSTAPLSPPRRRQRQRRPASAASANDTSDESHSGDDDDSDSDYDYNAGKHPADAAAKPTQESLFTAINHTYQYASQTLLSLLERRYGLRSHFHSLGKFFLLEHGDFFIQFMDMAEHELRREVNDITLSRLRHLLSMAIQTSTVAQDRHRESVSCSLAPHNLIQHLNLIQMAGDLSTVSSIAPPPPNSTAPSSTAIATSANAASFASLLAQPTQGLKGIEALQLEYSVTWPASIVFSRRAITKYQLLSRLLYFSKHVERRLLHAWQGQQYTRLLSALTRRSSSSLSVHHRPLAAILRLSYTLRQRMLHFLQNLVYYMTLEVIHPRVTQLLHDISHVTDMDRLLEIHEKFLDGCLRECLLASPDLLKVLTKLMTTALLFADHMVTLMDTCQRVSVMTPISLTIVGSLNATAHQQHGVITVSPLQDKKRSFSSKNPGNTDNNAADTDNKESTRDNKVDAMALARHRQLQQQRAHRHQLQTESLQEEISHEACHRVLTKFATTFDSQLKELLEGLWNNAYRQHAQLANLCVRLDYNGFYSSEFAT